MKQRKKKERINAKKLNRDFLVFAFDAVKDNNTKLLGRSLGCRSS